MVSCQVTEAWVHSTTFPTYRTSKKKLSPFDDTPGGSQGSSGCSSHIMYQHGTLVNGAKDHLTRRRLEPHRGTYIVFYPRRLPKKNVGYVGNENTCVTLPAGPIETQMFARIGFGQKKTLECQKLSGALFCVSKGPPGSSSILSRTHLTRSRRILGACARISCLGWFVTGSKPMRRQSLGLGRWAGWVCWFFGYSP